jgi:aminoglycoside phosphotransferase (APT) family kinase protein
VAAAAFDRERAATFLEKADVELPDTRLAGLRGAGDAALGLDDAFLRQCGAAFGLSSPLASRAPVQGTFHRLYDVRTPAGAALLRVAALPGERWASLMALESRLARLLRAAGLPVPSCEYVGVFSGGAVRGAQLVARVHGTSLADLDADEAGVMAALPEVARSLRGLHRLPGSGAGPLSLAALERDPPRVEGVHANWHDYLATRLDEHLHDCEGAHDLSHEEASRVRALFAAARERLRAAPAVLLHGDPGSQNFIVEGGAIRAMLDWEDALVGDPLFDLASLCTFHPERRHAAILAGYGEKLAPRGEAWERFWLYFLRVALAKTVHRRRFGYADKPGRAPAARRIQLALARLEAVAA